MLGGKKTGYWINYPFRDISEIDKGTGLGLPLEPSPNY